MKNLKMLPRDLLCVSVCGRKKMSKKKFLSLNPQNITNTFWYYEEPKGLIIVHEIRQEDNSYMRTDQIIIPWKNILKSVNRYKKDSNARNI